MLPCIQVLWYLHSLVIMRLFGPTPTVSPVAAVSTKKGSRTPDHSVQCSQRAEKPADEHRHALGLARDSAGPTSTKVGTDKQTHACADGAIRTTPRIRKSGKHS